MYLMFCLTKMLQGAGKIVVLGYGFCVIRVLVNMKKKGVYGDYLINNRLYWHCYINGLKQGLLHKKVFWGHGCNSWEA